jgi:DNA-binding NarL/FixJ family response regulator
MAKIRVLLVDDHAILRDGLRALLSLHDDLQIVGEAADGREAIEKVRALSPDVVLMDIAMPGLGGLEATVEIHRTNPSVRVLVLTQHENKEYIYPVLKAGAAGYVLKKAVGAELIAAIRAVHAGDAYLHPAIARAVVDGYVDREAQARSEDRYDKLSDRERQVLKLVADGLSNQEIADVLCLSVKTIMGYRANAMEKLGIHSRTELVKYAIRKGLVKVEE